MNHQTHYDTLEVAQDATGEEIKRAFHAKIKAEHPDKSSNDNKQELATSIIEAYKTLSDPVLRSDYDAEIATKHQKAFKGQCFNEINSSNENENIDYECEQCGEVNTVTIQPKQRKAQTSVVIECIGCNLRLQVNFSEV